MIKNFDKKLNWNAKYMPNTRVTKLIGTRQLEVSDPTGRLRKVNIWYVHKVLPLEFIVSCTQMNTFLLGKASPLMTHTYSRK